MRYITYLKDMLYITGEKTGYIIWYIAIDIAMEGALLLPPIATSSIIGVLTSDGDINKILLWALFYVGAYAIYTFIRAWAHHMYINMAKKYHILLQRKMFEHVVKNDAIFDEVSKGKIIASCTDDIRWVVDVPDCIAMATSRITKIIVIFVIFAVHNIWAALIAVLFDLVYMLLMDKNMRRYSRHFDGSRKYEDKAADILNQVLGNSKQIKVMNILPAMLKKYDRISKKWTEQYVLRRRDRRKIYVYDEWMAYLGKIALYIMLGIFVINKEMTIETLVLLISYSEQVVTSTNELWRDCLRPLSEYGVQTARIRRILSFTQRSEVEFGDLDNDYINGLVEFKNVSLEKKKKKVLSHVSFKARPNEITAIVGPKGAGKTSVVRLLHKMEHLSSGQILLDGESIYDYSKRVYNSNVSGVFQKPFVLEMSIRDNLGLIDKNRKRQKEICDRIGLSKIIAQLPKKYDTIVTEGEDVISEGDKQLIAVARAILSRAEVLVFDEVSAVGAQAIPNLSSILEDLKQDHTIILITHDADLIRAADRVVEMKNGKVLRSLRKKQIKR